MRKGGINRFAQIEADVISGRALLWIGWDGSEIVAAVVTQINETDADKVCVIVACGGFGMRDWLPLLDRLEAYARDDGCGLMRIFGRKGWARVLKDYRPTRVIMDKRL